MQPFYYRLWGKENCISLYTSYALKNEESFWITANVDEMKGTTTYCNESISMKINAGLKIYVLLCRDYDWHFRLKIFSYLYLFINVLKSFKSPEIYSVLNPIIKVCQRIECFWRTVILFWNISICSSWKEASKDQRGSYRKSSWDDVSLERKYILLKNVFLRSTIFLCQNQSDLAFYWRLGYDE